MTVLYNIKRKVVLPPPLESRVCSIHSSTCCLFCHFLNICALFGSRLCLINHRNLTLARSPTRHTHTYVHINITLINDLERKVELKSTLSLRSSYINSSPTTTYYYSLLATLDSTNAMLSRMFIYIVRTMNATK